VKKAIFGLAAILIILGNGSSLSSAMAAVKCSQNRDVMNLLKEIHNEIVLLGRYPGQNFFKREFFVGEDDDDTNKDIHVAVVIHETDTDEKMTIQVTYMERIKGRPVVGIAKSSKSIKCSCMGDHFDIKHTGFNNKEMNSILRDILRAIHDKKRLLKSRYN
jgi:hypothetical protein